MSTSENRTGPDTPPPPDSAARLRARLVVCRRGYADLVAAGWAGLAAWCEGDPDPWGYLIDELPRPPAGHPLIHLWNTATATGWGWGR
jgi:hypothetical protein